MVQLELYSLITGTSVSLLIAYFLINLRKLHKSYDMIKDLTSSLIIIQLGYLVLNIALVIASVEVFLPQDINEDAIYAFGYLSFLILWILGYNRYLHKTIRLSSDKLTSFNWVNRLLNIPIGMAFVLGIIVMEIIPPLSDYVFSFIDLMELSALSFAAMSQIALVTFYYFYRKLNQEQSKNSSKLIKARLQLLAQSIVPQVILSIFIVAATLLIFFGFYSTEIIPILFVGMSVMTVISSIYINWAINIPNRIRMKFNLSPNRFKFIQSQTR